MIVALDDAGEDIDTGQQVLHFYHVAEAAKCRVVQRLAARFACMPSGALWAYTAYVQLHKQSAVASVESPARA
jgi:hypothetical protein